MEWPDRIAQLDAEKRQLREELVSTISREWRLPFFVTLVGWLELEWQELVNTNHFTEAVGLRRVIDRLTSIGDDAERKATHGPPHY